jgi:hypothetical protein
VEPAGVVVDADSQQDAIAKARRWIDANREYQFGPRVLLVEQRDEPIELGDAEARLIQVPDWSGFPELVEALRIEQERMEAAERDEEAMSRGVFSLTEVGVMEEQAHDERRRRRRARLLKLFGREG